MKKAFFSVAFDLFGHFRALPFVIMEKVSPTFDRRIFTQKTVKIPTAIFEHE
jgi:hypothetical protein